LGLIPARNGADNIRHSTKNKRVNQGMIRKSL
jgi:hypothetical protein